VKPEIRQARILENLVNMKNGFKNDEFAKAFGITVDGAMTQVVGRVLDPPVLGYNKGIRFF
jgi:hypothetical protein